VWGGNVREECNRRIVLRSQQIGEIETFNKVKSHELSVNERVQRIRNLMLQNFNQTTICLSRAVQLPQCLMLKEEIPADEIARHAPELRATLETICLSPSFRTSPKSCEFLRHIVEHTISRNTDELKERLIGIVLLGRHTTYDTGSDAGVRVRANDVRKRLIAYNAALQADSSFTLDLPAGTYIPRFFRCTEVASEAPAISGQEPWTFSQGEGLGSPSAEPAQLPPLSFHQLARPTLIALFLCTICLRWQLAEEHPFVTFWQTVLQNHRVVLLLPDSGASKQQLISMQRVDEAAPLLNLAGQFRSHLDLATDGIPPLSSSDTVVAIGTAAPGENGPQQASNRNLLSVRTTPNGNAIVDSSGTGFHPNISGPAALMTIVDGSHRSILIDGTSDAAISWLVKQLCERDTFPEQLAESLHGGTVTQLVFPMAPRAEPIVFRTPLNGADSTEELRR
jgi:hypothetical protein